MCSGAGFGMGSRSATTSPTGSVHSTPTHSVKPNTLDPFADIGNLGGSFGGQFTTYAHFIIVSPALRAMSFIFLCRFGVLQQTHHSYRAKPFHAPHGLPIEASCIPPAYCWLSLVATRSCEWWRMANPRTRHSSTAETQPQPHPHVSQFPPESTQLQRQLLCNGRGLAQCRQQSTGWHG